MNSTNATHAPGVVIDRHERDTLHREVAYIVPGDEMPVVDRDEALEHLRRVEFSFALLEDIGWSKNDPRDRFVITMDRDLLRTVITRHREGVVALIPDDRARLEEAIAGDPGAQVLNDPEKSVEVHRGTLNNDLDMLRACDVILAQLDADEATR